ncbi:polysaccharide deacetylase family protein [Hyalangium rubrum]|uniref:Polysaccharide deacetylase family protein n=1 Tax=Hyalangium rubrum TaxID=3103134 RepID=A0ABU5H4D5_9BACT|nr:polysaccharide deacetylase family protein [Hyalangium sp. s54d21]MDY7228210.1 polysaccharide deacetylase family protein [Hyalangium sp. s54d21]
MHWKRWGVGVLLVLGGLIGLWRLSNARGFQLFGALHHRVEISERVVALTFDDGPGPANTPAVLELLSRHQVKATFFMVGRNIESHRELAARVLAEGHQLGNHSYSHERLVLRSPSFVEQEISRTDALLREVGVRGDIPFRAPFGKKLFVLPWVLSRQGRPHVTFDVVPDDHATQDAALITSRVLEATQPGSIILLHDGWAPKPGSIEAAGRIIESLKAQGYRFVTVSELLALGGVAPARG